MIPIDLGVMVPWWFNWLGFKFDLPFAFFPKPREILA
jgi:hypothetical protein